MPGFNDIPSFDKYISYPIAEKVVPFLRETMDLTPNAVTLINFTIRLLIVYYYYNNNLNYVVLLTSILTHIIDSIDGTMARKYDMGTPIGKKLDMYTDIIFWGAIFIITLTKYKLNTLTYLFVAGTLALPLINVLFEEDKYQNFLEMNAPIFAIVFFVLVKFT